MYNEIAEALYGETFTNAMRIHGNKRGEVTIDGRPIDEGDADYYHDKLFADWCEPDYDGWWDDDYLETVPPSYAGGTRVKTWWRHANVDPGLEIDQRHRTKDRIYSMRDQPYDKGPSHPKSIEQRRIRYCRQHATFRGHFWPEDLEEPQEDLLYAFVGLMQ